MEICFIYHNHKHINQYQYDNHQYVYDYDFYQYDYYVNQYQHNDQYKHIDEYEYNDNLIDMKILFNPKSGAPIKDVLFKHSRYFAEPFLPGKIVKVDDSLADEILETFGFVQEVTASEAKRLMVQGEEVHKCEKCGKEVSTKLALAGHQRTHEVEEVLDGIRTVNLVTVDTVEEPKKRDPFAAGEAEDKAAGLDYGEGLVNEGPKRSVIMR